MHSQVGASCSVIRHLVLCTGRPLALPGRTAMVLWSFIGWLPTMLLMLAVPAPRRFCRAALVLGLTCCLVFAVTLPWRVLAASLWLYADVA